MDRKASRENGKWRDAMQDCARCSSIGNRKPMRSLGCFGGGLPHVSWVRGRAGISTWWRHQMETFSALLAFCAGNSPATGEFPSQRPATRSFNIFFHRCLNKWLGKQSRGWWFETPSCSLWRHCIEWWGNTSRFTCVYIWLECSHREKGTDHTVLCWDVFVCEKIDKMCKSKVQIE